METRLLGAEEAGAVLPLVKDKKYWSSSESLMNRESAVSQR